MIVNTLAKACQPSLLTTSPLRSKPSAYTCLRRGRPLAKQRHGRKGLFSRGTPDRVLTQLHAVSSTNDAPESNAEADALAVVTNHLAKTGGCDLLAATPEIEAAVKKLIELGEAEGHAERSLIEGDGVWEVFYMPHIRRIAEPLGVKVQPLRYSILDGKITSDVGYSAPVVGAGWLNSGGEVKQANDEQVQILFDTFWVGKPSQEPRGNPFTQAQDSQSVEEQRISALDSVINAVGKQGFLPSFSYFPVLYFSADEGVCIFKFPPLNSAIAAYRLTAIA
ncbi:hypothetical protein CYMTET_28731 [Cymbomonas tetramitiformis]|uniref:Uncharacterized protein n=1 Tax=Cymbomonas tetramitiformis TaxID=36881 RepID=A0AAE0FMB3_9CHLO|nr:hypothetical protein CYMTET_28731 [Cymbomonas tetramitiformis]